MLFIKSLTLTNFGRHKKLEAIINGYVPGITGPNGLGKTTILQGLQLAYSGTIDHPDPLRSWIRRTSGKSPNYAEVESEFVADGREGRIVRRITRTTITHKLWWDGAEKPITKAAEIASIMFDILGVDKKAINSTVFIRQGEMASMFGQETDRRDFYTRLLMLGHLEKISRQVDNYRESTASSVQDLGAACDQAEGTAREASVYFDEVDKALVEIPDRSDDLKAARKLQAVYEDYDEAKEAEDKALTSLTPIVEQGLEPADWVECKKREQSEAHAELEKLTTRKGAHLNASRVFSDAKDRLHKANELTQKFSAVHEVEAALVKLGEIGEDPGPKVRKAEETLAKFDRLEDIDIELPPLKIDLEQTQKSMVQLSQLTESSGAAYDKAREAYALVRDNRKMRSDFLDHLDKNAGQHDDCPLCHASGIPDAALIQVDLERDIERLKELEAEGADLKQKYHAASEAEAAARTRERDLRTRVDALAAEEKRLKIETSLTSRSDLEKAIADGKEKAKAFAAASFEHERLSKELAIKKAAVENHRMPTQNEMENVKAAHSDAAEDLRKAPWSETDDAAEDKASTAAKKIREEIDKVQRHLSDLDSAQNRRVKIEKELNEAYSAAPDGLFSEPHVTYAEVVSKVEELEAKQKEHDEARGRREAANQQLKSANARIVELETRVAEQKHRLDLVKDLAELRDAFKPTGVSLEYLNYKFGQIAQLAGDYLAESGADFMVAPSEELPLSFDFLRTDRENEVWMGQSRMSGGQKVRLAVATLRAIHAMVMPNVGLLVLDEPTTHLDEEAKRSMAEMLQKIGEEGTLQMIVCDHSSTLIEAFSDTIEIPS